MLTDIIHAIEEIERQAPRNLPDFTDPIRRRADNLKQIIDPVLLRLPIPQRIQNIKEIISFIDSRSRTSRDILGNTRRYYNDILNQLIKDLLTKSEFTDYKKQISKSEFTDYEKHISKVISIARKSKLKPAWEFMWQYGRKKGEKPDLSRAEYIRELAFVGNIDSAYRWMNEYNNVEKMLLDGQ